MLKMRERGHEKDFISSQSEEQHSIELLRCYDFILFPFFPFLNAVSKLCHVFVWELVHYPCEAVRNKNRKNFLRCALKRKASAYFVLHIAKCAFKNQEKVFFFLHKNSSCWWNKANGRYKCKCEFLSIVDDWKISVYRNHLKFMKWDSHKNFSRNAQCAAEEEQKNKKKSLRVWLKNSSKTRKVHLLSILCVKSEHGMCTFVAISSSWRQFELAREIDEMRDWFWKYAIFVQNNFKVYWLVNFTKFFVSSSIFKSLS
jgi:hypothetical protein